MSLCQIAAVRARMRWATRAQTPAMVRPPWASRSSWPLRVSLIDSMIWRSGLKKRSPVRVGSPLRAGRSSSIPAPARSASKVRAVVVLVADHGLPAAGCDRGRDRGGGEDVVQGVAFVGFGAGQRPADGQTVQGADQVQPQPPEEPGVGGAVAVLGPSGQIGALDGLAGAGALDRGRVDHPDVVVGDAGLGAQHSGPARPSWRRVSAAACCSPTAAGSCGNITSRCARA